MPTIRSSRSHRTQVTLIAAGSVLALLLAGCVPPPRHQSKPSPATSAPSLEGRGLDEFYAQQVDWADCGMYECAWVQAPLDWDAPEAGSIELAMRRSRATGSAGERVGSLLINPGGPGSSGIDFLDYAVSGMFGPEVLAAYDVVGFDPRGVGSSTAVDCGDFAVIDEFFTADIQLESQADVEAARERTREFGQACLDATGPLLGEIDTVSAARDMDLMRAVLGDTELYYAGFSYGTSLGATYADLYPEHVGRMLLDGALDPSLTNDELLIGQAVGFENALRAYVTWCLDSSGCPLSGGVDAAMRQVAEVPQRAEAQPLDAGSGRTVNGTLAMYGIVVTLYDDGSWTYLSLALEEALQRGTGETLLDLANYYLDRTPDGAYTTNAMVAFTAINCLDYPMPVRDYPELVEFAEEVAAVAPTFGRDFGMAIGCETWPFRAVGVAQEIHAPGAAPILVVGTTGDPATPYEWSVALAEQLDSGTLLTFEGEGHTGYGRGSDCVDRTVDAYLVRGEVPADGITC